MGNSSQGKLDTTEQPRLKSPTAGQLPAPDQTFRPPSGSRRPEAAPRVPKRENSGLTGARRQAAAPNGGSRGRRAPAQPQRRISQEIQSLAGGPEVGFRENEAVSKFWTIPIVVSHTSAGSYCPAQSSVVRWSIPGNTGRDTGLIRGWVSSLPNATQSPDASSNTTVVQNAGTTCWLTWATQPSSSPPMA